MPKVIENDEWFFNPASMELVPKLIKYSDDSELLKGDEMKRAEVTYRLYGSVAEVVGYKNILTFKEIIKAVGRENANRYIRDGAHFYLVNDAEYLKRNGCEHEYIRLGKGINTEANTRTFSMGSTFPIDEMRYIISLMKEAGNNLSGINTFTVKI